MHLPSGNKNSKMVNSFYTTKEVKVNETEYEKEEEKQKPTTINLKIVCSINPPKQCSEEHNLKYFKCSN